MHAIPVSDIFNVVVGGNVGRTNWGYIIGGPGWLFDRTTGNFYAGNVTMRPASQSEGIGGA